MHDIHIANQIFKTALKYAKKNKCKKINSITVELGKIVEHNELITPDNLKYNIKLISKNTIAQNCKIIINPKNNNNIKLIEIDGE